MDLIQSRNEIPLQKPDEKSEARKYLNVSSKDKKEFKVN